MAAVKDGSRSRNRFQMKGNKPVSADKRNAFQRALFVVLQEGGVDEHGAFKRLVKIAKNLVTSAEANEPWAVTEIMNRVDGKPEQRVAMPSGDEAGGEPVQLIRFTIVDAIRRPTAEEAGAVAGYLDGPSTAQ